MRGLIGPVGSGKSVGCANEIMHRANQSLYDSKWAVVRNTYGELEDTTMATWFDWFGSYGHFSQKKMTHEIPLDNERVLSVMFRALDKPKDAKKLLSLELSAAWFNEAREISFDIVRNMRPRVLRFPKKEIAPDAWHGIIMDTNPPDTDHWWYKRFVEEPNPQWQCFHQPSGRSAEAENIANLVNDYYNTIAQGESDEWVRIYVDGEYGFVQDGKPVYPEYRDSIHCMEFAPWPDADIYIGLDFGLTPAAVFSQRSGMGQVRVFDELVMDRGGAVQLAEALKPMLKKYPGHRYRIEGDPSGEQGSSIDSEQTVFRILQANGIDAHPSLVNDNNTVQRREAGRAPMTRMVDGEPGLLLHPRCKRLRKALGGKFQYKRMQVTGDARYRDKPDKDEWSHVAEAYEYCMIAAGENPKASKEQIPAVIVPQGKAWSPYEA